jgi:hypothetical protein
LAKIVNLNFGSEINRQMVHVLHFACEGTVVVGAAVVGAAVVGAAVVVAAAGAADVGALVVAA